MTTYCLFFLSVAIRKNDGVPERNLRKRKMSPVSGDELGA